MDFNKIKVVEKIFDRVDPKPRGQSFKGLKVRRWLSDGKETKGELQETVILSDELFNKLNLEEYAMTQINLDPGVGLLVLEDQDEVEPQAKFLRRSKKKDGALYKKGKGFYNEYLIKALVEEGLIVPYDENNPLTRKNQYLQLEELTNINNVPSVVKGVYRVVADTSVTEEENEGEEEEVSSPQNEEF